MNGINKYGLKQIGKLNIIGLEIVKIVGIIDIFLIVFNFFDLLNSVRIINVFVILELEKFMK